MNYFTKADNELFGFLIRLSEILLVLYYRRYGKGRFICMEVLLVLSKDQKLAS